MANLDFQTKKEFISVGIKLLSRYNFNFNRIESSSKPLGERALVFSFRPKANLPEGIMEEKALNHLAGEVYIDQKTMTFKGLTAHLISNVKYARSGFLGGKLNKLDCIIKTEVIDGHSAINFIRAEYQYSIRMFGWSRNVYSIKTIFYQNYERRL